MLCDLSGHFLPALVTACEGWFWLRSLIMLFAEAVCKAFDQCETPQACDTARCPPAENPRADLVRIDVSLRRVRAH